MFSFLLLILGFLLIGVIVWAFTISTFWGVIAIIGVFGSLVFLGYLHFRELKNWEFKTN